LYPIILNNMFDAAGFATGVRAVAFMDLGLLTLANLIMRTSVTPKLPSEKYVALKEVLSDVPYLTFVIGAFLLFWGVFVPFFYLQLHAASHGVSPLFVKYSITLMNAASILGRTVPNLLADIYGPLNVIIPFSFVSGALAFGMLGASTNCGVAAFGIFYGFFSGAVISVVTPAATSFVTHCNYSDLGLRIGVLSFSLAFAVLTGNPIAGALLSPPEYKWLQPIIFASAVMFMGACCHLMARRGLVERKGRGLTSGCQLFQSRQVHL